MIDAREPSVRPLMRVMVATDGSADARAAVEWLAHVSFPAAAQVLAIMVVTVPAAPLEVPTVQQFTQALRDDAVRVVESARTTLGSRWPGAQARVCEGEPRAELLRAIEEWAPDLVVMGARGLGAVAGALLGSVSLAIARHASCAVLVVKPGARPVRTVLVAADGSDDSAAAAAFLAALPLPSTLQVRVVGVVEPPHFPASAPPSVQPVLRGAMNDIVRERSDELAKALGRVAAPLHGKAMVKEMVVVGHPADAIVQQAKDVGADIVVVGARGLGPVTRLLLGSVSERVLRHAECAVLIVKRRTR